MKKIKSTIVMVFIAITSLMAQNKSDDIIGIWETETKDAKMEIFKDGSIYYGKLLWGDKIVESDGKTSKKDSKNTDEKLRSRDIIGIVNLYGLRYENGTYVDGTIYDPPSGKTYDCKAWIENGKLQLRGYIGFSLIGRTATWNKL
ncbi:DUF2147 domain-containing protein [Aquiflexum lacus]|uniref:DUF2147 domain-containing protein n=1 Tax=Aquiflexum lacus TaxID=2483805 RepID=UPI001894B728|nr:DUF2147 domain-containing protein [Aquiflexum lacus]